MDDSVEMGDDENVSWDEPTVGGGRKRKLEEDADYGVAFDESLSGDEPPFKKQRPEADSPNPLEEVD